MIFRRSKTLVLAELILHSFFFSVACCAVGAASNERFMDASSSISKKNS